ncbi:hypothetical protein Vi05172_g4033 [Venturia inaequalis]|nr:hypothetical protein Vi05172_g4033 [Venturia inaequalis]
MNNQSQGIETEGSPLTAPPRADAATYREIPLTTPSINIPFPHQEQSPEPIASPLFVRERQLIIERSTRKITRPFKLTTSQP